MDVIFDEMTTDGEEREAQSGNLERLYTCSSQEQRKAIDDALICVCGWRLETLNQLKKQ